MSEVEVALRRPV